SESTRDPRSSLALEIVDAAIVLLVQNTAFTPDEVSKLIRTDEMTRLLRPPLTFAQATILDSERGAMAISHVVESPRTFQSVAIAPFRIEVHDKSGDIEQERELPRRSRALLEMLRIESASAVGINFEATMKETEFGSAAEGIARRLLRDNLFTAN